MTGAGRPVVLGSSLPKGGQAELWVVRDPPRMVFKRYTEDYLRKDGDLQRRLEAMVAAPPAGIREPRSGHAMAAWPAEVVYDDGKFVGFVMPIIDVRHTVELHEIANPSSRAVASGDSAWMRGFSWQYLVRTAVNLSLATATLHQTRRVVVGDFNERNVRVWSDARVSLLDCDSMQIRSPGGEYFLCRVGVMDATAPELPPRVWKSTIRLPSSDNFALAVHIHQLLLEGEHPFRGMWHGAGDKPSAAHLAREGVWTHAGDKRLSPRPIAIGIDILPDSLIEHFTRAFVLGASDPSKRPTATEWRSSLEALQDSLKTCRSDRSHVYRAGLRRCPWCRKAEPARPRQWRIARRPHQPPASPPSPSPGTPQRGNAAASSTPPVARPAWSRERFVAGVKRSFFAIIVVGAVAALVGAVWSATTFEHVAGNIPYLRGLLLLVHIAGWTAIPAFLASVLFDASAASKTSQRMAVLRWTRWHRNLVILAAALPPIALIMSTSDGRLTAWGGSRYGPPVWFWWMAPAAMTVVHIVSLVVRASREK